MPATKRTGSWELVLFCVHGTFGLLFWGDGFCLFCVCVHTVCLKARLSHSPASFRLASAEQSPSVSHRHPVYVQPVAMPPLITATCDLVQGATCTVFENQFGEKNGGGMYATGGLSSTLGPRSKQTPALPPAGSRQLQP
jgi:hypothetical protein